MIKEKNSSMDTIKASRILIFVDFSVFLNDLLFRIYMFIIRIPNIQIKEVLKTATTTINILKIVCFP